MNGTRTLKLLLAAAGAALALSAAACGDEDHGSDHSTSGTPKEEAFLSAMVPHHESAVEMARIADQRAVDGDIKALATAILADQTREISQMQDIHRRLFDRDLQPDATAMGPGHSMSHGEIERLNAAKPFDREFVDLMIPHHQSAIVMAEAALEGTNDPETRKLEQAIIKAQAREIAEMKRWRIALYGPNTEPQESGQDGVHGGGHSG